MLKQHGMDYAFWVDDLYLDFQSYVPEELRIQIIQH